MNSIEARAIRANRRALGVEARQNSPPLVDSSLDGSDIAPDPNPDVGEDSDSTAIANGQEQEQPQDEDLQGDFDEDDGNASSEDEQPSAPETEIGSDAPSQLSQLSNNVPVDHKDSGSSSDPSESEDDDLPDSDTSSTGSTSDDNEDSESKESSSDSSRSSGSLSSGSRSPSSESESSDDSSSDDGSSESSDSEDSRSHRKKKKSSKKPNANAKIAKLTSQLKKALAKDKLTTKSSSKKKNSKKTSKGKTKKSPKKSRKSNKAKKSKKSKKKGKIEIEIGAVPNGDLVQLQPFWAEQMEELDSSIPLTVFDQTFARADREEYNRNHHSSSSKVKSNRGLEAPSEFALTFGEWSECMSLFRRYLAGYYNQGPLAKRLKLHIENVKSIKRSTECWMTALRYDILCRSQIFVKRGPKEKMKDIGTLVVKYENQAKEKSLRFGEANGGDSNPYAKGGKMEHKHPETGVYRSQRQPTQSTSAVSNKQPNTTVETQTYKRKRGPRNRNRAETDTQQQAQLLPPAQHPLPANPLLSQGHQPMPQAAPMAANRFPMRGGRGGRGAWRGGRGGFNPRADEG